MLKEGAIGSLRYVSFLAGEQHKYLLDTDGLGIYLVHGNITVFTTEERQEMKEGDFLFLRKAQREVVITAEEESVCVVRRLI